MSGSSVTQFPYEDEEVIDADGKIPQVTRRQLSHAGSDEERALLKMHGLTEVIIRHRPQIFDKQAHGSDPEVVQVALLREDQEEPTAYFMTKQGDKPQDYDITTEAENYISLGYDTETGRLKVDIDDYDEQTKEYMILGERTINQYEALELRSLLMAIQRLE